MVPGMEAALGAALGQPLAVAPQPQLTCAFGAAILAWRRLNGSAAPASEVMIVHPIDDVE